MTGGGLDSHNIAFWDDNSRRYRCYNRYFHDGRLRAIQNAVSADFIVWDPQQRNEYAADVPEEQFYTNSTMLCPGAKHMYLSFPMRFVPDRRLIAQHAHPGVSDTMFMTSRDGVRWTARSWRHGYVRETTGATGPTAAAWWRTGPRSWRPNPAGCRSM
jgi:hypothetical protein